MKEKNAMPDSTSPAHLVLDALGYALFLREEDGSLRVAGKSPNWLAQLWPALEKANANLPVADASPFFENFLIDAEECWKAGGDKRARSGPWIEEKGDGENVELEATALTAEGQQLLLIERLGADFSAKKDVLQKARETVIAHQQLNSEIQKKEILLHCVADEMTTALANIVTSLRLIETEDNPPRTKVLLGLAMRGTEEQQRLINRALDAFSEEINGIYGRTKANSIAAEWSVALQSAFAMMEPNFAEKKMRLVRPTNGVKAVHVPVDAGYLQRVLGGLLENALDRAPAGGEVALTFEEEEETILCRVTDSAPRMSADAYADLFSQFGLPAAGSHASAVRLHFCRVVVEGCGGEIGCEPGEPSGNCFWIRLPKVVSK